MPEKPNLSISSSRGRILVIDDEADIRESLEALLSLEGFVVDLAPNGTEGLRAMQEAQYDLVLLDLMMPDLNGMEVLTEARKQDRSTPIFMLTAYGSIEQAVLALKQGAQDYLSKPWENDKLLLEIDRVISKRRLEEENAQLKRALKQRYSFNNIVGKSERMLKVLDLVTQVANSKSNILVTGETGTGKDLVATAIHAHSDRRDAPFVPVNSGAVPAELLESTLFGHVKGAFTGASLTRKGLFESANHGTIFFDEIGTITLETQAKLLRVIQTREFTPVGSNDLIHVDVRIVAATNADLRRLVDEGRFREDLYYRLNVINIVLPPLRERKEDLPLLIDHFLDFYCRRDEKFADPVAHTLPRFEREALQLLIEHNWPGNVRELENAVERAVVLSSGPSLTADLLPDSLLQATGVLIRRDENGNLPQDASLSDMVNDFERRKIMEHLERAGGSQTEAAETLRIPLSTLNQKIKRLGIDPRKR